MPGSFCVVCRRRISSGSRCAKHRTSSPSSRAWARPGAAALRERALKRDGACRICGAVEELQVHHLDAVAAGGANTLENVIVLCRACHLEIERTPGLQSPPPAALAPKKRLDISFPDG